MQHADKILKSDTRKSSASPSYQKGQASFFSPVIQPKLTINQPNDIYEQEADAVAEKVMRMPDTKAEPVFFQPKPLPVTPVQRKCAACDEEEKLQRKEDEEQQALQLKPEKSFDIQRKCDHCEEEEKAESKPLASFIQKKQSSVNKADVATDNVSSQIQSSKGNGNSMPEKTKSFMGSRFGADFSNVGIHSNSYASQLSNQLNAQAFTVGNDIYFNEGKYSPETDTGKHLLAHELTHVVQQRGGENGIQKTDLIDVAGGLLFGPLIGPQVAHFLVDPLKIPKPHRPYELKGNVIFNPDIFLQVYLDNALENAVFVPLNVCFGDMGSGTIKVSRNNSGAYQADSQLIPVSHPAFDIDTSIDSMALQVKIIDNQITGKLVAFRLPQAILNSTIDTLLVSPTTGALEGFSDEDIYHAILGKDYDTGELQVSHYENQLQSGELSMIFIGHLSIGGDQKMLALFTLVNELSIWTGTLSVSVDGLEDTDMKIERDNKSNLFGELPSIGLNKEWSTDDKRFSGSLQVEYNEGFLDIRGEVEFDYADGKLTGQLGLRVTDENIAWEEANKRIPPAAKSGDLSPNQLALSKKLALVGWGDLQVRILEDEEGNSKLSGEAAFVLDPGGDVTVAGSITTSRIFELVEEKADPESDDPKDWKVLIEKKTWSDWIRMAYVPIPWGLRPELSFGLKWKKFVGPVYAYDVTIGGVFSTRDDIKNSIKLSTKVTGVAGVKVAAELEGKLTGRVGAKYWLTGKDIASVSITLNPKAGITAFLHGEPAIEAVFDKEGSGKWPQFFLKGFVDVGAELDFDFDATFKLETIIGDWEDSVHFGKRTLPGFSIKTDMNYHIGTMPSVGYEDPTKSFSFSFHRQPYPIGDIIRDLAKAHNKEDNKFKGDFKQNGKSVGGVDKDGSPVPDAPASEEIEITDDFEMMGESHVMSLILGDPGTDPMLYMSTTPKLLIPKINEERVAAETAKNNVLIDSVAKAKIQRRIDELEKIAWSAFKVIEKARVLGFDQIDKAKTRIPGFEELGDLLSEYANKYGVTDLNDLRFDNEGEAPGSKTNPFEIMWPKPPSRDYEPLYFGGEIGHSKKQSKLKDIFKRDQKDETGTKVQQYLPESKSTLAGGQTIGIAPEYRIYTGKVVGPLTTEGTPGGDKLNRIIKKYGFVPDDDGRYADHIQEIQLGGDDVVENLWPLDIGINGDSGRFFQNGSVTYPKTGKKVKISDLKGRVRKYWLVVKGFDYKK